MKYNEFDNHKQAFIFELDNVLYPEKDYLYQVYYLFSNLLEYTTMADAKKTTAILVNAQVEKGKALAFDELKEKAGIDETYRAKLNELMQTAKLPLKLLLFNEMLTFLQDIIIDRKQLFIVTNGNPLMQLNKIKQTEWHGLEKYLKVFFAEETRPMPESDIVDLLLNTNKLKRKEVLMIGKSPESSLCAKNSGIDYIDAGVIIK